MLHMNTKMDENQSFDLFDINISINHFLSFITCKKLSQN